MGNMPAKDLRQILDDLGLTFVSGHVSVDDIQGSFEALLDEYATLGAGYAGLAWIGEDYRTDAGWNRAARLMEKARSRRPSMV